MKEVILDTLFDGVKLLPFLFITFLFLEYFEHKFSKKSVNLVKKSNKFGPVIGSILGIIPQCGFSVMATNLYITRIISLGTLFSIYLSTSDEMLPLLIADKAPFSLIFKILIIKFLFGIFYGYIIDLIIRKKEKPNYDICNDECCNCKHSIFLASLKHTFNIFIFVLISTFIINVIMQYLGNRYLEAIFLKDNIFGSFITGLIGLIPNCASSIILTELFLKDAISFGSLIGGLLPASGVALLVLFKENKNRKISIFIISLLYLIGVFTGIIIDIIVR